MSIQVISTLGLESCPRCRGNVMIDEDQYGRYELCIQCGYLCDLEGATKVDKWSAGSRAEYAGNGQEAKLNTR